MGDEIVKGGRIVRFSDEEVDRARTVLGYHVADPVNSAAALETLLFCIASQGSQWEVASDFVYMLRAERREGVSYRQWPMRYARLDVLENQSLVHAKSVEAGNRFPHENRFSPAIRRINELRKEKPYDWYEEVISADAETRNRWASGKSSYGGTKVKWVADKTFSFWHLCLGGKNLITIDIHVARALHDLGVEIPERFREHQQRPSGQRVVTTLTGDSYLGVEKKAVDLFSQDARFLADGEVDCALVTSLLWWTGANRNGGDENSYMQYELFDHSEYLPYCRK